MFFLNATLHNNGGYQLKSLCIAFKPKPFKPKPQRGLYTTALIVHRIVLFGPGSLLPRWRTEKQAKGRCQLFIIYKCYSELFTSIDRTCERNIHFLNQVRKSCLQKHIDTVIMTLSLPVVYVLNFSDDPYINSIFLRKMVNRLFFSPRNPKYI